MTETAQTPDALPGGREPVLALAEALYDAIERSEPPTEGRRTHHSRKHGARIPLVSE